jgi:hypothetical protein
MAILIEQNATEPQHSTVPLAAKNRQIAYKKKMSCLGKTKSLKCVDRSNRDAKQNKLNEDSLMRWKNQQIFCPNNYRRVGEENGHT